MALGPYITNIIATRIGLRSVARRNVRKHSNAIRLDIDDTPSNVHSLKGLSDCRQTASSIGWRLNDSSTILGHSTSQIRQLSTLIQGLRASCNWFACSTVDYVENGSMSRSRHTGPQSWKSNYLITSLCTIHPKKTGLSAVLCDQLVLLAQFAKFADVSAFT